MTGVEHPADTDDTDDVAVTVADGWLTARLNRPRQRNAIRMATWRQLDAALDRAETDAGVAGITVTGGDRWFSAGADLGEVAGSAAADTDLWVSVSRLRHGQRTLGRLRTFGKPTIAAVEGYAIGVAWSLALSCDLMVAARSAFFAQPAAGAGMIADGGLARDLRDAVGYRRAAELLLTRDRLPAADALRDGLVNELVEPGGTQARAAELAAHIAGLPASVRFMTKSMLAATRGGGPGGGADFLEHEALAVAFNRRSPERAGVAQRFRAGERFFSTRAR